MELGTHQSRVDEATRRHTARLLGSQLVIPNEAPGVDGIDLAKPSPTPAPAGNPNCLSDLGKPCAPPSALTDDASVQTVEPFYSFFGQAAVDFMVQTCVYKKEGQSTLAWDVAVQWPSAPTKVYQEAFHVDLTAATTKIDGCNTFTYAQTPVSTPQTDDKGNKIADKVTNKNTITPLLSDALLTYTFDHIWAQSAEPVPTNIVMLCMASLTPADMVLAQAAYTAGGKTAWAADAGTVQQGICVMSQVVTSKVYSAQPLPPIDASAESDSVSTPTGASAGVQLPPAQQRAAAAGAAAAALNANCAPEIVCSAMKPCLVAGAKGDKYADWLFPAQGNTLDASGARLYPVFDCPVDPATGLKPACSVVGAEDPNGYSIVTPGVCYTRAEDAGQSTCRLEQNAACLGPAAAINPAPLDLCADPQLAPSAAPSLAPSAGPDAAGAALPASRKCVFAKAAAPVLPTGDAAATGVRALRADGLTPVRRALSAHGSEVHAMLVASGVPHESAYNLATTYPATMLAMTSRITRHPAARAHGARVLAAEHAHRSDAAASHRRALQFAHSGSVDVAEAVGAAPSYGYQPAPAADAHAYRELQVAPSAGPSFAPSFRPSPTFNPNLPALGGPGNACTGPADSSGMPTCTVVDFCYSNPDVCMYGPTGPWGALGAFGAEHRPTPVCGLASSPANCAALTDAAFAEEAERARGPEPQGRGAARRLERPGAPARRGRALAAVRRERQQGQRRVGGPQRALGALRGLPPRAQQCHCHGCARRQGAGGCRCRLQGAARQRRQGVRLGGLADLQGHAAALCGQLHGRLRLLLRHDAHVLPGHQHAGHQRPDGPHRHPGRLGGL